MEFQLLGSGTGKPLSELKDDLKPDGYLIESKSIPLANFPVGGVLSWVDKIDDFSRVERPYT